MIKLLDLLGLPVATIFLILIIWGLVSMLKVFANFLGNHVMPYYFEKSKTPDELIIPYAEKVLDKNWTKPQFFRDGNPKYIDFEKNMICTRPEVHKSIAYLQNNRFLYIQGPPSSGKSVIGLNIAYKLLKMKQNVIYFLRPSEIDEVFITFLTSTTAKKEIDKNSSVIVVDDVHLDIPLCFRMFNIIFNKLSAVKFLLISRNISLENLGRNDVEQIGFTNFMQREDVMPEKGTMVIAEYFSQQKFKKELPPAMRNFIYQECNNDLLVLGRYLREWDGNTTINTVQYREKVYSSLYEDLLKLKKQSPQSIRGLILISLFYRLEVSIECGFVEQKINMDMSFLINRGEVKKENNMLSLYHSSQAKMIIDMAQQRQLVEYDDLSKKHKPFPFEIFKQYVSFSPRNLCEFFVRIRKSKGLYKFILKEQDLQEPIRHSIEKEQNLTFLGWALVLIFGHNKSIGWEILKNVDVTINNNRSVEASTPSVVSLFLFNLYRVSELKAREWIESISPTVFVDKLRNLELNKLALTLKTIKKASPSHWAMIKELDLSFLLSTFLKEENVQNFKTALSIIIRLLEGQICTRVKYKKEITGEFTTIVTLYYRNKKEMLYLHGEKINIPYGTSRHHPLKHQNWLVENRKANCGVVLDGGAIAAIKKRNTLLPVGVSGIHGHFEVGDIVGISTESHTLVAVGVVNFSSLELSRIKKLNSNAISKIEGINPNRVFDNDRIVLINILPK